MISFYKQNFKNQTENYFFWYWYEQQQPRNIALWQFQQHDDKYYKNIASNNILENDTEIKKIEKTNYFPYISKSTEKQIRDAEQKQYEIYSETENQAAKKQHVKLQHQIAENQYTKSQNQQNEMKQYQKQQQYEIQKQQNLLQKEFSQKVFHQKTFNQKAFQKEQYQISYNAQQNKKSVLEREFIKKQYEINTNTEKIIFSNDPQKQQNDFWKYQYLFLEQQQNDSEQMQNVFETEYFSEYFNEQNFISNQQQKEMPFYQNKNQSIWQKENQIQIQQQKEKQTQNIKTIQNIVKNSLEQKQQIQQKQQKQQIQKQIQQQNINVDTLFLNMTEKLLEQRERSLKANKKI